MTSNLTRRTALLGTVTLPAALAPLAAMANDASTRDLGAEPDPAYEAFKEWWPLMLNYAEAAKRECIDWTDEEIEALHERELEAMLALADAVPTTPLGMVCKLYCAINIFGDPPLGGDWRKPEDYEIQGYGFDQGKRVLLSMLIPELHERRVVCGRRYVQIRVVHGSVLSIVSRRCMGDLYPRYPAGAWRAHGENMDLS